MMQPAHRIFKRCDDAMISEGKYEPLGCRLQYQTHILFPRAWKWVVTYSALMVAVYKLANEVENLTTN